MNILKDIDFYDFYFNGHYLSEFGGIVGGTERLKQYSLLPSRVYTTDRAINQDGATVFSSYLEPRTFEVPVFFENIDDYGLRNIAGWLNTPDSNWFHYKDDTLKIKCNLDSEGSMLESLSGYDGYYNLKFIAHDPYYYELNETTYSYTNIKTSNVKYSYTNLGNTVCYPYFKIQGRDKITINIYNSSNTLIETCSVKDCTTGFQLDCLTHDCLTISGGQKFNDFSGEFFSLPTGVFYIEIIGTITGLVITPRYRWV